MLRNLKPYLFSALLATASINLSAQQIADQVNVFLGTSGDHGQLSPGASSPFHQMDIAPQTSPNLHAGYEHYAKKIVGFTHNRFEGVGCVGSGGLLMVQPYVGEQVGILEKSSEQAGPGFYEIDLKEGIQARFAVHENLGIHQYTFPKGKKGVRLRLNHAFNGAFVSNEYKLLADGTLLGKVRAKTTCHAGTYSIYYAISLPKGTTTTADQEVTIALESEAERAELKVAFSAVDEASALQTLHKNKNVDYASLKKITLQHWNEQLSHIQVEGDSDRVKLFYSLFYRTLQSPYRTSEADGRYRGTDGQIHQAKGQRYHGWAIWDNYKTQLPLLALAFPSKYQDIVSSIADLYKYGKYDFAGPQEPANSVRTEHAAVVLLDAQRKGFSLDVKGIRDSLIRDTSRFDFSKPDKYLEAAYDMWAMARLLPKDSAHYNARSRTYKNIWNKEFRDLSQRDVDRMSARNMYQGTIRQYRWNVPYDMVGLTRLIGGKAELSKQLDDFFDNYYFNRANEPDIQSPTLYYASDKPWRYQSLLHELALDTVVQYYFNDNSRGIDPFIDRIYKNEPKAFVRTMDDDAGAMSGWFVMTALGLQQPLVGAPVYYLNVPLFPSITLGEGKNKLKITVHGFKQENRYIQRVRLNGKDLNRLWLRHDEIAKGGHLEIDATDSPSKYGQDTIWIADLEKDDKL
ncbi:glycoside hydrolase domain-containing protein [Sphingobacterium bambusae]|uniref:Glycoside hydrolase domain-containing protein n=1 Tax=Sphingobacterium bambusae TaxID=662858 RepID=A0ABW6BMI6_9SPHI|nr:glycoside hydrolase domain-containing protein [Sphingobacterium bambusae]WPL46683.1 glycoside hydrolase family 92 protein [Sphingobacterium bambusae]